MTQVVGMNRLKKPSSKIVFLAVVLVLIPCLANQQGTHVFFLFFPGKEDMSYVH